MVVEPPQSPPGGHSLPLARRVLPHDRPAGRRGTHQRSPGNFRSTITGSTVRLEWNAVPEPVISFRIEAGSATTLADLAILNTGNALTILTVTNVPGGLYCVRVRAVGTDGIPGPASNEITVRVGPVTCGSAPAAPSNLSTVVNGNQVALNWNAATDGDAATTLRGRGRLRTRT